MVNGIMSFSSATESMTGAADNRGPVGTTLALIEQGSKVYSGIHKRMHKAARFEFKLIAQLNYEHMDDEYPYEVTGGNRKIFKSDFDGRVDIIPVSEPNLYSNVQRVAQAQAILELVEGSPDVYDEEAKRLAHIKMHKALRTPDIDSMLPKKRTKRLDPITENQIVLTGGAVEAYPEQDHDSHIKVHTIFMQEAEGMNLAPEIMQAGFLNMSAHIAQHHAHNYRLRIEQELGVELPDTDCRAIRDEEDVPIEIDNAVARAVAKNVAPPTPAQGAEPDEAEQKQAEHEQKLSHNNEIHQQKMGHKEEEHDLSLTGKDESAEQDRDSKQQDAAQDRSKKAADNMRDSADRAAKLTDS